MMEVHATYVWQANDQNKVKQHVFLPTRDIRGIIVGKSGFGKTTLLTYLLLESNVLDYDTLSVCGNTLHQPEYRIMEAAFGKHLSKNQIRVLFERQSEVMPRGGPEKVIQSYDGSCKGKYLTPRSMTQHVKIY